MRLYKWLAFTFSAHTLMACGGGHSGLPKASKSLAGSPGVSLPTKVTMTQLSEDALVITSHPYASNSLLLRTAQDQIILVDTPFTPADTENLLAWVKHRWGRYPAFAINSHWHIDATGGNQVLRDRNIEVISSKRTAHLLRTRGDDMRRTLVQDYANRYPDTAQELKIFRPTPATRQIALDDLAELDLGGEVVHLIYAGPSHSPDAIGIFFPGRDLLYGGCAVRSNGRLGNLDGIDLRHWPRVMKRFARLQAKVVVPGHGRRFDPQMLSETIAAVRALSAERNANVEH